VQDLFTIGYGGRSPDELVRLLRSHGVRTVLDVRLRPDRAGMGAFVKARTADKGIQTLLAAVDIQYRSLPELGNLFLDFDDWRDRYGELLMKAGDLLTVRLSDATPPVCLLCAEKRAADCHRRLIAEHVERTGGLRVIHIE